MTAEQGPEDKNAKEADESKTPAVTPTVGPTNGRILIISEGELKEVGPDEDGIFRFSN